MAPANEEGRIEENLPGIIPELGELGSGALVDMGGIANLFNRCERTIQRAIDKGELPPPTRMFGKKTWTVGVIVSHIETRLAEAAKEREQAEQKFKRMSP